jgi:Protein of unknown function (DUF4235)
MSKLLFTPVSIAGGLVAGVIGKKLFERLWSVFDDEEAPEAKHRDIPWEKLIPALLIEGAIFRVIRGLFDHGARRAFNRATGTWPGEEAPDRA